MLYIFPRSDSTVGWNWQSNNGLCRLPKSWLR